MEYANEILLWFAFVFLGTGFCVSIIDKLLLNLVIYGILFLSLGIYLDIYYYKKKIEKIQEDYKKKIEKIQED